MPTRKKIAVILAGSGVRDGSEVNEVVLSLLCLSLAGTSYTCYAPDRAQLQVMNHATGVVEEGETRDILAESSRLVSDKVLPLSELHCGDVHGLLVPGGFGTITNLCNYAAAGPNMRVRADFLSLAHEMIMLKKPVALMSVAAVMAPKIYKHPVFLTLGSDLVLAQVVKSMGGTHINCSVDDAYVDLQNRLVTAPVNLLAKSMKETFSGVRACVKELLKLVNQDSIN